MASESWEHCIALLEAGASPAEVLPNLRALFRTLPNEQGVSSAHASTRGPGSLLSHRLEASQPPFSVPYLRPPPFVWDILREADGRPALESSIFDTELDVDVLEPFSALQLPEPSPTVRRLLNTPSHWASPIPSHPSSKKAHDDDSVESSSPALGTKQSRPRTSSETAPESLSLSQLSALAHDMSDYLRSRHDTLSDDDNPVWPDLTIEQWALILCGPQTEVVLEYTEPIVRHLLETVQQPSFAIVVLNSLLPPLIHTVEEATFLSLLELALSIGQVSKTMPPSQTSLLVQLYRSLDDGPLGALAQLSILTSIHKH